MHIHRIVDGTAHALRRVQLHNGRDDRRMMTLIEGGAGKAARRVEQVGGSSDTAERFFYALEPVDRDIELLTRPFPPTRSRSRRKAVTRRACAPFATKSAAATATRANGTIRCARSLDLF